MFNQGSAYPNGPRNTCGCCAAGTIINKAGGKTNERQVVDYALPRGLCDGDGFTGIRDIAQILSDAGIKSSTYGGFFIGPSMDKLAEMVEQGRGVIIGVDAEAFYPGYGVIGGHAIVIESVVRDAKTGKILDFVVADSNAKDKISVCNRIPVKVLERAFRLKGRQAVVTDDIIW